MSPETLDAFLSGENAIRFVSTDALEAAARAQASADRLTIEVTLGEKTTKSDALNELARAFDMPRWFGHNWDALEDCLTDLEWLPEEPMTVIVSGSLLESRDVGTMAEILTSACTYWQAEQRGFHVLLDERLKPTDA